MNFDSYYDPPEPPEMPDEIPAKCRYCGERHVISTNEDATPCPTEGCEGIFYLDQMIDDLTSEEESTAAHFDTLEERDEL